jgi:hypothetical protein
MPFEATGPYTMAHVVADLRDIPVEIRRKVRPAVVKVAQPILAAAKARAGWSSRIPDAIRLSVVAKGVILRVSLKKAPHARAYEGISSGRTGNFRHPVYGHEDRWVAQRERPFVIPAVAQYMHTVEPAIVEAVDQVLRARGWTR